MLMAGEEFVTAVDALLPRAYAANPGAADHLKRSAESALFNAGEAYGAYQPRVKINGYENGKKEASEARVVMRRLVRQRVFTWEEIRPAYNAAGTFIGMLTAAIISVAKRLDA